MNRGLFHLRRVDLRIVRDQMLTVCYPAAVAFGLGSADRGPTGASKASLRRLATTKKEPGHGGYMRRQLLVSLAVLAIVGGLSSQASADPGGDGGNRFGVLDLVTATLIGADDDLFVTTDAPMSAGGGNDQFGPYPSTTTDSGTCGIDWATDDVDRYFHIQPTGTMTFRVIEKFKQGTFLTNFAPSPGACDSSDGTGPGFVNTGVSGHFQGYIVMTITSTTYMPGNASCTSPCFYSDDFLRTVFGPAYLRSDDAYFFHYQAANQPLTYHEWKNASCNRGGNHGDIQSAGALFTEVPLCP